MSLHLGRHDPGDRLADRRVHLRDDGELRSGGAYRADPLPIADRPRRQELTSDYFRSK